MIRICNSLTFMSLILICSGCADSASDSAVPPVRTAEEPSAPVPAAEVAASEPTGSTTPAIETTELQSFDGMKFAVPSTFAAMPLSEMQKGIIAAKFGIPSIGEDINFTLSVSGGTVEDNIGRWKGQFSGGSAPVQETLSTSAGEATVVKLSGNFAPGMGRPPQSDWSMVGVIIPMGERNYYAKLTGPTAQVTRAEESFLTFCKSARPE